MNSNSTNTVAASTFYLVPRVDVFEDSAGVTLLADLPGVRKDALDIQVDGTNLRLEGRVFDGTPQPTDAVAFEMSASHYRRAFTLSERLDTSAIDAQLKDGVLRLRIPKLAEAQPKRVEVRIG
ncbi:MAG: Hsp20/alpha crystallin family protein [Burkholderiaceae bacterium]|nr:Hsp20/alpha crystallin family protein [Burkholderiaceae bacterium]